MIGIYETLQLTKVDYTFNSIYMWSIYHKISLNKVKRIQAIQNIFNYRKVHGKLSNTWKLNNILQNKPQIIEKQKGKLLGCQESHSVFFYAQTCQDFPSDPVVIIPTQVTFFYSVLLKSELK